MRKRYSINKDWLFHFGPISEPLKLAKKAHALGGLTAPLDDEDGERVLTGEGGNHFLKLIAQGNREVGLRNLASTDLSSKLKDSWKKIDVPHDWKVALAYENDPSNQMSGYKPEGISYYRQTFSLHPDDFIDHRILLHFDGIMGISDFWLNGAYLGQNFSGYTTIDFDVTEICRKQSEGINALLVKVDTTAGHEGWWYEGAGIYKNVWLEVLPEAHILPESLVVTTMELSEDIAEINLQFEVINEGFRELEIIPSIELFGKISQLAESTLAPFEKKKFDLKFVENNPKLWSPEIPNLYTVKVRLNEGNDIVEKNFGIHLFKYDKNGFYLNHQPYQLYGVCEHQDFAGVGIALNQDIVDYKIQELKKMGINAIRSAHHFASEELLSACDRLGMLMINENRLLENTPWRQTDLMKMIKKSRHHACIAFWSVANEEVIGNTSFGYRIAKKIVQIIRSLDSEHLIISAELLNPEGLVDKEYLQQFDVLGVNYPEAGVMGPGAKLIKEQFHDLPIMSTENASYFSTRGAYQDNQELCQCNNFGSMFSMVLPGKREPDDPGVGGTAHPEEVVAYFKEKPYMGGVFLWTGFDYFGEPSPFQWPAVSTQFGVLDTCGFKKDYYHFYKAFFTKEAFVHVMPHWNQEALEKDEFGKVAVRAFSNFEEAECFVNGKSYGRKKIVNQRIDWQVKYEPGELKVIAYDNYDNQVEDCQFTSGQMEDVLVSKVFEGKNTILYSIKATDKQKRFVPTANTLVKLKAKNGKIIGVGNGNPVQQRNFNLSEVQLFNGKALVIVQKGKYECELNIQFS